MASAEQSAATAGRSGLPLFPDMEAASPFGGPVDARSPFQDPLLQQLNASRPVQRLTRIGFLGAVDRVRSRNWYSRHEHSVAVARLALLYARTRSLSQHDTRVLAVAGLLHDVGHGPLSHTLEPVFQERFGISHHKAGYEIIRGETSLGREIPDVLARHGLDPDEVTAMIAGTHNGRHAYLFSSPINLDTIEGVTRCFFFFVKRRSETISAERIVREVSETDTPPARTLDSFWSLKHQMYNSAIHHSVGLLYDGLAQAVAIHNIDRFEPHDFLKDDEQLRRDKQRLFTFLDCARRSPGELRNILPDSILEHEIVAPIRAFRCDPSVELKKSTDLPFRYIQTKKYRRVPIDHLLPPEVPTKCHYRIMQGELSMNVRFAPRTSSESCVKPLKPSLTPTWSF